MHQLSSKKFERSPQSFIYSTKLTIFFYLNGKGSEKNPIKKKKNRKNQYSKLS